MARVSDYLCNGCGQSYAECECATSSRTKRTKFKNKVPQSNSRDATDTENSGGTYSSDYGWSGN